MLIQDRETGRWEVVSFPWQSNNDASIRQSHFPDENILEKYIRGALLFWTTVIFININNVSDCFFSVLFFSSLNDSDHLYDASFYDDDDDDDACNCVCVGLSDG